MKELIVRMNYLLERSSLQEENNLFLSEITFSILKNKAFSIVKKKK